MKTVSPALLAHLRGEVTTLATVWRVSRSDGAVLGFTDHDQDLVFAGLTFTAASGFTASAVESRLDLSLDSLEVQGVLSDDRITDADLLAGRYDGARVEVALVNYAALPAAFAPGDLLWLRTGWIGEVRRTDQGFIAEIRGHAQRLQQTTGAVVSPVCRYTLGEARCGVALAAFAQDSAVQVVTGRQMLTVPGLTRPAGWYEGGVMTYLSGPLAGVPFEIGFSVPGTIRLLEKAKMELPTGVVVRCTPGCDKTWRRASPNSATG